MEAQLAAHDAPTASFERSTYAKVTARLVPLLFVSYVVAYLDRVNVGFAKLQMQGDLQFTDAIFGLGAGIFFLGYFLFEVPSNIILHKVGARRWIARIMISWGVVSSAMMFTSSVPMFYTLRFILGVAEAGFFPGVILYLTYWYPAEHRTRITAMFMSAVAISGIVGSPFSGWILKAFGGINGWAGWQWLFLLEGLPSIVMGLVVLFYLDDRISAAKWLSADEKRLLENNISGEDKLRTHAALRDAFTNPRVWMLGVIYFLFVVGLYGVSFWLPTIIRNMGVKDTLDIGLLTAIPYLVAAIGMVLFGRRSDRTKRRRFYTIFAAILGMVGLIAAGQMASMPSLAIAALSIATLGIISSLPLFWSMPTNFLGGTAAAAGIALINSIGNLGGYIGPQVPAWVKPFSADPSAALYIMSACMLVGALLVATIPGKIVDR